MAKAHTHFSHPGIILKEEFLEPLSVRPGTLAQAIGVDRARIKAIVDGTRDITADTAVRLARFFGTTSQFWLNLQHHYDLSLAEVALAPALKRIKPWQMPDEKR